jgi:hypothetical protein
MGDAAVTGTAGSWITLMSAGMEPMNKGAGGQPGRQRSDRKRFPYEPRLVGGKLMMPSDLQRIHRFMLDTEVIEAISDEVRAVVESLWPELIHKLPPKESA